MGIVKTCGVSHSHAEVNTKTTINLNKVRISPTVKNTYRVPNSFLSNGSINNAHIFFFNHAG